MTNFLVPLSTCIFIYIFYSLAMKNELKVKPFLLSAILASAVVGLIVISSRYFVNLA